MLETYKNFREIAELISEDLSNEMISSYKDNQDMVTLAKVYVKYFPHFTNVAVKFYNITDQDKASCIVEEIHKALMNYDETKGASIQTLCTKYINYRLRAETQSENYQLRKANSESNSYEELLEANSIPDFTVESNSILETLSVIETLGLTENEKRYCEIILMDETSKLADKTKDTIVKSTTKILDTEVGELMNMTGAGVSYIRKNLAKKLTPNMILGI